MAVSSAHLNASVAPAQLGAPSRDLPMRPQRFPNALGTNRDFTTLAGREALDTPVERSTTGAAPIGTQKTLDKCVCQ